MSKLKSLGQRVAGQVGAVTAKKNATLLGADTVDAGKLGTWNILAKQTVKVAEQDRTVCVYDAGVYEPGDGSKIPMIAFGMAGTWSGKAKKMSVDNFEAWLRASAQLAKELL